MQENPKNMVSVGFGFKQTYPHSKIVGISTKMKGRVETAKKNKKQKSKWNRIHTFQYKKATKSTKRHPTYNFAKNNRSVKYLVFTTQETTDGVEKSSGSLPERIADFVYGTFFL